MADDDGTGGDWEPKLIELARAYRKAWYESRDAEDKHWQASTFETVTLVEVYRTEDTEREARQALMQHIRRSSCNTSDEGRPSDG